MFIPCIGSSKRLTAVVGIRDGGADAAIVEIGAGTRCNILAHAQSKLALEERPAEQAAAMAAQEAAEACTKALELLGKQGSRAPIADAYVVVHPPWVSSQTTHASAAFKQSTRIKDATIAEAARQSLAVLKRQTPPFEASVVRVVLSGYPTRAPENKRATALEVFSHVSDCDASVREKIGAAVSQALPHARVLWRSLPRLALSSLPHVRESMRDYLLVEVGMSMTWLGAVHNGVLSGERVVAQGLQSMLVRAAAGGTAESALSLVRMSARDACEDEHCEQVKTSLAAAEPELARMFGEALGALAQETRIGNDLILMAHPDARDWFARFFSRIDFAQFTVTTLPFSPSFPDVHMMGEYVENTADIDDSLMLSIAGVHIESRA